MLSSKTFQFMVGILLLELLKLYCLCRVSVRFLFPGISDNEAAISEMQMACGLVAVQVCAPVVAFFLFIFHCAICSDKLISVLGLCGRVLVAGEGASGVAPVRSCSNLLRLQVGPAAGQGRAHQ